MALKLRIGSPCLESRLLNSYEESKKNCQTSQAIALIDEKIENLKKSVLFKQRALESRANSSKNEEEIPNPTFRHMMKMPKEEQNSLSSAVIEVWYGRKHGQLDGLLLFSSAHPENNKKLYKEIEKEVREKVKEEEYNNAQECFEHFKKTAEFLREKFSIDPYTNQKENKVVVCVYAKEDDGSPSMADSATFDTKDECIYFGYPSEYCMPALKVIDCIAHEITHAIVFWTIRWTYHGESGALDESQADVVASMLKQCLSGVNDAAKAKDEDWSIAPGFFLPHKEFPNYRESFSLRSMKNPGFAYEGHKHYGSDTQVQHFRNLADTRRFSQQEYNDYGGVHDNAGIPSRAFYLAASKIGGPSWDIPGKIWMQTMQKARKGYRENFSDYNFYDFAKGTLKEVGRMGFPEEKKNKILGIVKNAWRTVGVFRKKDLRDNSKLIESLSLDSPLNNTMTSNSSGVGESLEDSQDSKIQDKDTTRTFMCDRCHGKESSQKKITDLEEESNQNDDDSFSDITLTSDDEEDPQENVLTEASEQPIEVEREDPQENVLTEASEQPIEVEREDPQENVLTEASEQPIQCEREGRQEDVLIEAGEQPIQCEREDPQENISTDVNCWSVFTKCFRRTRNTTRVSEV